MTLSKDQCLNIKGYAMLLIILYNFLRHQIEIDGNEMYFSATYTKDFVENIFTSQGVVYLFSFCGWIGVPLFLFLSGYGLSRKYGDADIHFFNYFKRHCVKLWILLVPIFLLYILINNSIFDHGFSGKAIVAQVFFIINLCNPNAIDPGTYWFFGLILQFYLLFLFLRKKPVLYLAILGIGAMVIDYCVMYFLDESSIRYLKHNCIGWLVPFIIGIWFEKTELQICKSQCVKVLFISVVLFPFALTIKCLSPFTQILAIIIFVCFIYLYTNRVIQYIGVISSSLFVVHPVFRMIINNTMDSKNMLLLASFLYVFLTISGGAIHNYIVNKFK